MIHTSPIFILLIQVALILVLSRAMAALAARCRQPQVVGEMIAGIALGPSLFGWIAPGLAAAVFPPESTGLLNVLAQIGVVFFLFLIGLELDLGMLRRSGYRAVVISQASIVLPFALGAGMTFALYPVLFGDAPHVRLAPAALFMGAAMSVTAFPVLARILTERGWQKTDLGVIAITCAAIDDVSAWCMLAFVVAIARAEGLVPGLITASASVVYVLLMFFGVRPLLRRLETVSERPTGSPRFVLAVVLVLVLLSAAATEAIGIHALFGAFVMGAIMPKGAGFVRMITEKLEDFTVIFLLPVFFAYAGLRTKIGLLDSPYLWGMTGLVIAVACAGKFGGSALAARVTGMGWRESMAVGTLMNTRGLVELVILTIGLQAGVITEAVYAMMVIMALVTTAMTTPVLHWIYPSHLLDAEAVATAGGVPAAPDYAIVVPVSRPESVPALVRVAAAVAKPGRPPKLYGLSLRRAPQMETFGANAGAEAVASPAMGTFLSETARMGVAAEPFSFASRDIASDIARVARVRNADLILMGFHKPVFGQTILGGTVHRVLTGADTNVAILVDRGLPAVPRILVPYQGSQHDRLALKLASRLALQAGTVATVLHVVPPGGRGGAGAPQGSLVRESLPDGVRVEVVEGASPVDVVLARAKDYDLLVVGLGEEWGLQSQMFGLRAQRLAQESKASLILVRKHALSSSFDLPADAAAPEAPREGLPAT